ncbi:NeuD/PglB/VioB family sugar acetyltransferase [Acetatifactor aquisgranensis]|uniref:NeuD/PglB/VioB family sugar acetyltransferase n=1 Tax=Acetatifactor aquisgranensis TaxID=2941233 RepID=UPI002041B27C|nr:NeuD/PglB/VioB family sugar acetyltransferase [Acetatifactor aquisgranensis]
MIFAIYGAGGSGRTFMNLALRRNKEEHEWSDIIYVDDIIGISEWEGRKVYTFQQVTEKFSQTEVQFIISQGEPSTREKLFSKIREKGYSFYTYIDKSALVCEGASIGEGCMIAPNVFIDAHVKIGNNTLVYIGAVVGHDTKLGMHSVVSVSSFIGGHCVLEEKSYVGPGAMIRDRISVGKEAVLAMGAAVYKDVPEKMVAIGNPARMMKHQEGKGLF